jgi:dGTP triphosphohydrolase
MHKYNIDSANDYLKFVKDREKDLHNAAAHSIDAEYSWIKSGKSAKIDFNDFTLRKNSFRTPFLIDYDLITYSKYFMKLSGKTQIFISPSDTQLITRSSHTEIVLTLAKVMARGLYLNEDLVGAMAKGHDIGHTAFGHSGEFELDAICKENFCYCTLNKLAQDDNKYRSLKLKYDLKNDDDLASIPILERALDDTCAELMRKEFYIVPEDKTIFSHARQSFRLLCVFEGKQLTAQTVHGIINHNLPKDIYGKTIIDFSDTISRIPDENPLKRNPADKSKEEKYLIYQKHQTYEGQILKFADFIAFCIHDVDDALRDKKLDEVNLQRTFSRKFPSLKFEDFLVGPNRYSRYILDFTETNRIKIENGENALSLSTQNYDVLSWLYSDIVKQKIHNHEDIIRRSSEGKKYIRGIYDLWKVSPKKIRDFSSELVPEIEISFNSGYSNTRKFCDFISALTDNEIIMIYRNFYGPECHIR